MEHKIVVFGARGRLGARLVEFFSKFLQVECINCFAKLNGEIEFRNYNGSLVDLETLLPRRAGLRYVLINCTAYTNLVGYGENRLLGFCLNVLVPKKINALKKKRDDLKIIHFSTDAFYSGGTSKESDYLCLFNYYCADKYKAETELMSEAGNLIFRLNFYGKSLTNPSFSDYIIHCARYRLPINLTECEFSPIAMNIIFPVIKHAIENNLRGVFNLCGSHSYSKSEFAKRLLKFYDFSPILRINSRRDLSKSKNMSMSNSKLLTAVKDQSIHVLLNMNLEQVFEIEYKNR